MVSTGVMWCSVFRVYIANISPTQSTVQCITCQVCTQSTFLPYNSLGTGLAKCCNSSVEQLWHCRNVTLLPRKRHCKSKQGQVWNTKPKCQTRVVWKWGLGETAIPWVVLVYPGWDWYVLGGAGIRGNYVDMRGDGDTGIMRFSTEAPELTHSTLCITALQYIAQENSLIISWFRENKTLRINLIILHIYAEYNLFIDRKTWGCNRAHDSAGAA